MGRSRWLLGGIGVVASVVVLLGPPTGAAPGFEAPSIHPDVTAGDNNTCLACHQQPGLTFALPSGEVIDAFIDRSRWETSAHGMEQQACVECHTDITAVPHDPPAAFDRRIYTTDHSQVCTDCHTDEAGLMADDVHADALAAGNREAATCSDCHDPHYATEHPVGRTEVASTCSTCHYSIYQEYADSVHGSALTEGNPDVPTCTDCHGVHDVQGPENSPFRLFSPTICARCHADKELMDEYDISTNVFDTYVSDFHGTTVILFEEIAPDQKVNEAVCVDCHGIHNIIAPDDPNSTVFKDNLLRTCQRCHPDATAEFSSAWLGHYEPEPDKAALVYYVQLFYKIIIPLVIGGMLLFVLIDVYGRLRRKKVRHG